MNSEGLLLDHFEFSLENSSLDSITMEKKIEVFGLQLKGNVLIAFKQSFLLYTVGIVK